MGDGEAIVDAAVDLQFSDRADAEAEAEHRQPQQVPLESRGGIEDVPSVVESAFEQDQARADDFGIFSDEGPLLRRGGRRHQDASERRAREYSPCHVTSVTCGGPGDAGRPGVRSAKRRHPGVRSAKRRHAVPGVAIFSSIAAEMSPLAPVKRRFADLTPDWTRDLAPWMGRFADLTPRDG